MKSSLKITVLSLILVISTGCTHIARTVSTTEQGKHASTGSLEMEIQGCSVRTYVDGGSFYTRYGKVVVTTDKNMVLIAHAPNFNFLTGAMDFASLGIVNISRSDMEYYTILPDMEYGLRAYALVDPKNLESKQPTAIAGPDPKKVLDSTIIYAQTKQDLSRQCPNGIEWI